MRVIDIISKKRDGLTLSFKELKFMVEGYLFGDIDDARMSSFLMAIYLKGLGSDETISLTRAMLGTGKVLDLSSVDGFKVDKHSTGGVGDKLSLILVPLLASAGVKVPKLSGHALGHTGGTINKLMAIPGLKTNLSMDSFRSQLETVGAVFAGQSSEFAPADGKIYALRDRTGTVSSIPLIASSIMSKKLAAGSDGIVLDIKVGSGAFMKDLGSARRLAKMMIEIAKESGLKAIAVLSNMNEPLGRAIGDSNEVVEAIETLRGKGPEDLRELTMVVGSLMLLLSGGVKSVEEAREILKIKLDGGDGLSKFKEIISAQGGDSRVVEDSELLPVGKDREVFRKDQGGYLRFKDVECLGHAYRVLSLDGRGEYIPGAGLYLLKKSGEKVEKKEGLIEIVHNGGDIGAALSYIEKSIELVDRPTKEPLIYDIIHG